MPLNMEPLESVTMSVKTGSASTARIELNWDNAPNVGVTVIMENQLYQFEKDFLPENEVQLGKTWFLDVPGCQSFNVSMKA